MIHDDSFKIAESRCKKREERKTEENEATKNMRVRERDQGKNAKIQNENERNNKQTAKQKRK